MTCAIYGYLKILFTKLVVHVNTSKIYEHPSVMQALNEVQWQIKVKM